MFFASQDNNKAITETPFYYVTQDNENKIITQNDREE